MIAFGGLNWALDGAAAPVAAVQTTKARDGARRRIEPPGTCRPARGPVEIELRGLSFSYPRPIAPIFDGLT